VFDLVFKMATNGGNEPPTLFAIGQRKTPQILRGCLFYLLDTSSQNTTQNAGKGIFDLSAIVKR